MDEEEQREDEQGDNDGSHMPHVNEAVKYAARIDLGTGVETIGHMKLLDPTMWRTKFT